MLKVLFLMAFASAAHAGTTIQHTNRDGSKVKANPVVWKNMDTLNIGIQLIQEKHVKTIDEFEAKGLLSCYSTHGAEILVLDSGWASSEIMVVNTGCRGIVENELIRFDYSTN